MLRLGLKPAQPRLAAHQSKMCSANVFCIGFFIAELPGCRQGMIRLSLSFIKYLFAVQTRWECWYNAKRGSRLPAA